MKRVLIALLLTGTALSGCVTTVAPAPEIHVCPQLRDLGADESLKHYTIHVLNMYNLCREVAMGKHTDMPITDALQDIQDVKEAK